MNRFSHPTLDLNGEWSFAISNRSGAYTTLDELKNSELEVLPAIVPGNFELDLQRNSRIEEPFFGLNIADLRRYERSHLWYARRFEATPREGHEAYLVFEGIDCFAEIYLNGQHIGSCANMLVPHEFCVEGLLQGENELIVHLRPAFDEASKFDYPVNVLADTSRYESLFVRKAPHSYGWDIMPRALSGGLWRPVSLVYKPLERLESLYLETMTADESSARLLLHFNVKIEDPIGEHYEMELRGVCGESTFSRRQKVVFGAGKLPTMGLGQLVIENPHLWWPLGWGKANLYEVTVELFKNGEVIDSAHFRHGIRTVELERTSITGPNGEGEFVFRVNGEKIFIKGSNHVPADAYHSRDLERIPRILELAEECGCNMLRCWGGNVYENDLFYDLCDEKGILIWQDFAMGCTVHPHDEAFQKVLADEAKNVVRRLRGHACIALWAGDNECDLVPSWMGYKSDNPNSNVLTRVVLPRVLQAEDPRRTFLPSSPYIDDVAFNAGSKFLPEDHLWGPRDYFRSDFYKNSLCHFASEIGYHGCPSPSSIRKFISPENLWPNDNAEWLLHSTCPILGVSAEEGRIRLMTNQIREMFGVVPDNLEDYAFASQCVQAEAKKFFIELFRTQKWRRTGILWWNLIDGWPQFSDAVVDYYFEKKLAFEFIKRAQQPLLLAMREPENCQQELVACNDTRRDLTFSYIVRDVETNELIIEGNAIAPANTITLLARIPFSNSANRFYSLSWEGESTGSSHYLAGQPTFDFETYQRWLKSTYSKLR